MGQKEPIDFSRDFIARGKNSKTLVCELCKSKVLKPGIAQLVEKEVRMWTYGLLAASLHWVIIGLSLGYHWVNKKYMHIVLETPHYSTIV